MSHMINGFVFPSDLRLTLPSPTSSAIATPPPGSDNHYATDPVSESALLPSASSASVVVSPGTPVSSQNASRKGKRGFNDVEDPKEVSDDGASSSSKRKRRPNQGPYSCPYCPQRKPVKVRRELERHQHSKDCPGPKIRLECPEPNCHETLSRSDAVLRHRQLVHGYKKDAATSTVFTTPQLSAQPSTGSVADAMRGSTPPSSSTGSPSVSSGYTPNELPSLAPGPGFNDMTDVNYGSSGHDLYGSHAGIYEPRIPVMQSPIYTAGFRTIAFMGQPNVQPELPAASTYMNPLGFNNLFSFNDNDGLYMLPFVPPMSTSPVSSDYSSRTNTPIPMGPSSTTMLGETAVTASADEGLNYAPDLGFNGMHLDLYTAHSYD